MSRERLNFIGTSIKLDAKLHAAIARVAKARGCSVSHLIREAAAAAVDICPTCGRPHTMGRVKRAAA